MIAFIACQPFKAEDDALGPVRKYEHWWYEAGTFSIFNLHGASLTKQLLSEWLKDAHGVVALDQRTSALLKEWRIKHIRLIKNDAHTFKRLKEYVRLVKAGRS